MKAPVSFLAIVINGHHVNTSMGAGRRIQNDVRYGMTVAKA